MPIHSSKPYPLSMGPIELTTRSRDPATGKSAVKAPQYVEASFVPRWLAEIARARFHRLNETTGGLNVFMQSTLDEIERLHGGMLPLALLDVLAAGDGSGNKWMWLECRRTPAVEQALIEVPIYEHPSNLSCVPYPVQGSRVDDGTGMEAGEIPEWFAALLARRMARWCKDPAITLESVRKVGGFTPLQLLDLCIGGRGDGLGHRIVEKHWRSTAALTDLESSLLAGADEPPVQVVAQ